MKKIIITTSILLIVFTAASSYHKLVYNFDTKAVDFDLGSSKTEIANTKELKMTINFLVYFWLKIQIMIRATKKHWK